MAGRSAVQPHPQRTQSPVPPAGETEMRQHLGVRGESSGGCPEGSALWRSPRRGTRPYLRTGTRFCPRHSRGDIP